MVKILIATANKHKASELSKILPRQLNNGGVIEYISLTDLPNATEPEENGATLKDNAIIKAKAGLADSCLISLADDTGLMVDALNGAPGVYSGRYAYPDRADYPANNQKLLQELKGLPMEKRTARFVTVAAMALPNGIVYLREGTVEGYIATDYQGDNGFGYDPLFIVKDLNKTMAQLTPEEKNQISHRGKAFAQMAEVIKNLSF